MAHTHAPAPSTSVNPAAHQRRLIATLTVTGSVFLIEVVSAVLTGSLALLVDAGHMLFALRGAPHNPRHTDAPQAQQHSYLGLGQA